MADREKVIKRLEECLSASCRGFRTCPYSDNEWDAVESALALLREQKPVKPNPTGIEPHYNCGKCGLPIQQGYPFCPWCGKAVKWDAAD